MRYLGILLIIMIFVQPILAERPPDGYARPPLRVRGNATSAPTGLVPAQARKAYGIDQLPNSGAGQTVAIVDAFDDPNIASDLATFKAQFGVGPCNFSKIYASGKRPRTDSGWALE